MRPKYLGEVMRDQSAKEEVGIGNGQRPTLSITCGSRVSSCGVRTDNEKASSPEQNTAPAGCHGVDV